MGKVDHADNPEDHGITDCNQAINRSERQPVDKLLDKDGHPVGLSPLTLVLPVFTCHAGQIISILATVVQAQNTQPVPYGPRSAEIRTNSTTRQLHAHTIACFGNEGVAIAPSKGHAASLFWDGHGCLVVARLPHSKA